MTKYEIVSMIAKRSGLTRKQVNDCLQALLYVIKQTLAKEEKISIRGLGAFCVKDTKARKGYNLHSRQKIDISSRKIVKFKMCSWLLNLDRYF